MSAPYCPTCRRPMRRQEQFADVELVGIGSYRGGERDVWVTTWACACGARDETVERQT